MRLVAIFEDCEGMQAVRKQLKAEHLAFFEANRKEIPLSGGLRVQPDDEILVGGLWVFEVDSKERAIELIEADPFQKACPRKYRLYHWGKTLPKYMATL